MSLMSTSIKISRLRHSQLSLCSQASYINDRDFSRDNSAVKIGGGALGSQKSSVETSTTMKQLYSTMQVVQSIVSYFCVWMHSIPNYEKTIDTIQQVVCSRKQRPPSWQALIFAIAKYCIQQVRFFPQTFSCFAYGVSHVALGVWVKDADVRLRRRRRRRPASLHTSGSRRRKEECRILILHKLRNVSQHLALLYVLYSTNQKQVPLSKPRVAGQKKDRQSKPSSYYQ